MAYCLLLRDEFPPFSWDPGRYPVRFEIDYPEELNRWAPFVKWLLAIPSALVGTALFYGALLMLIPAWFAILFTGRFPRVLFDYIVGASRWYSRTYLYASLMTDEYPPWTMGARAPRRDWHGWPRRWA